MFGSRLALAATIALAIAATACGDNRAATGTSLSPPTTPSIPLTVITPTIPVTPTTPVPPITPAAPTSVGPIPPTIPPPSQPCAAGVMKLTAQPSDGAMGSIYTPLLLANTGAAACTVSTHLVLSFLDSNGQTIGVSVTTPEAAGPSLITLGPVESRQTVLRYAQSGNLDCQPIATPTTAQLIVNQTEALTLPPSVWPLCADRLADQVTLGDLEAPSP